MSMIVDVSGEVLYNADTRNLMKEVRNMDYEAMGGRIKSARQAKGLSQKELAAAAGLSISALQGIEKGNENVRLEAVARLADALGISLDTLVNPLIAENPEKIAQSISEARAMLLEAQEQMRGAMERLNACEQPMKIRWAKIVQGE